MIEEIDFQASSKHFDISLALIVATKREYQEAVKHVSAIEEEGFILRGYLENLNVLIGKIGLHNICLARTIDMGADQSGGSTYTTDTIIRCFKPKAIIMPGIAFGIDKAKNRIGDILISRAIAPYEQSRVNEDGTWNIRSTYPRSDDTLYSRFKSYSEHEYVFESKTYTSKIVPGLLLSGEKLVDNKKFKAQLVKHVPEAIGGEMEGVGLSTSAIKHSTPWIVVKAISDWGEGKNNDDNRSSLSPDKAQELASTSVFSYLTKILSMKNAFTNLNIISPPITKSSRIHSEDVLPLACPPAHINNLIDSKTIFSEPGCRFDYYNYTNMGRTEGFLFLDFNVDVERSIEQFKTSPQIEMPDVLTILLKRAPHRHYVSNRQTIVKSVATTLLPLKPSQIQAIYVDEFVMQATIGSPLSPQYTTVDEYIDQDIYKQDENIPTGKSIRHILDMIEQLDSNPVTMVYGTGGVGKTTFANTLCQTITKNHIKNIKKQTILIKGSRIIRVPQFEDTQIRSITDLYKAYNDNFDEYPLTTEQFRLNIACGNVILIIDGIDEIHSLLGDNFHISDFLESVIDMHEKWRLANVIITSRDFFDRELDNALSERSLKDIDKHIQKYTLKGFTVADLDIYLQKRSSEVKPRDVLDIVKQMYLFNQDRIDPMLVDFACEIVSLQSTDQEDISDRESEYLFKDIPTDRVVIELFHRENYAQATDLSIDETFLIYLEIEEKFNGKVTHDELRETVEAIDGKFENFIKTPLLTKTEKGAQQIYQTDRYEFFSTLIRARALCQELSTFNSGSTTNIIIKFLHDAHNPNSDIISQLVQTLKLSEDFSIAKLSLAHQKLASELQHCIKPQASRIKKTISGLVNILFAVTGANDKRSRTDALLKMCNSKDTIKDVHLHNSASSFDLSYAVFMNCSFVRFHSISECTFPADERQVFIDCHFDSINLTSAKQMKSGHFGQKCSFTNSNLKRVSEHNTDGAQAKVIEVKEAVIRITSLIDTGWQSENKIKNVVRSVPGNLSLREFLNRLCKAGYLDREQTRGTQSAKYVIQKSYRRHISRVCRDSIPPDLSKIIQSVALSL